MRRMSSTKLALALALALVPSAAACGKKGEEEAGASAKAGDGEAPPPFEVRVHKTEKLALVAANKAQEEAGLGKTPADGKTWVCVQYEVTSTADEPTGWGPAMLVDGKGTENEVSVTAAGSYQPADWKTDRGLDKVEPGATSKRADCFEVDQDATQGMKLKATRSGWGKRKGWSLTVDL